MGSVLAAAALAAAIAIAACGDSNDTSTFEQDDYPFTFEYPADFELSDDVSADTVLGGAADDSIALGIDDSNALVIQRYTLNAEVSEENIDQAKVEFDGLIQQLDPGVTGEAGETGGFPSLTYDAVRVPSLPDGESRLTVLFEGDQEYLLNCQSTPENRDEINAACDRALATLNET